MRIIATEADIAEGLARLVDADSRLRPVIAAAGPVPFRREPGGFAGLARVIVGQQLSNASAAAIWRRVAAAFPDLTPAVLSAAGDETLRGAGLSGPKIRALRATALACLSGLDLARLGTMPAPEAHATLTAIAGIGPWTADIYLQFCVGHADIFPAGDLALRRSVAAGLGLAEPPSPTALADIAASWSPWRSVAAWLFWSYYRVVRSNRGAPSG